MLLPNLERFDDGLYMIWYGKPEGNTTIRRSVMLSKIDFSGRISTSEVEIGPYTLGGLKVTRGREGIVLLKGSHYCDVIINPELIYLDKKGNIIGSFNISKFVLGYVGIGKTRDGWYGCSLVHLHTFKEFYTARDFVLVYGEVMIFTDIRAHFVALFDGAELRDSRIFGG